MNWLGLIAVMALAAIILSVVTDVEMAKCQKWFSLCNAIFLQAGQTGDDCPIRMQVSWRLRVS